MRRLLWLLLLLIPALCFADNGPPYAPQEVAELSPYSEDKKYNDDIALIFGTDSDFHFEYNSLSEHFQIDDGTNVFMDLSDIGTVGHFNIYGVTDYHRHPDNTPFDNLEVLGLHMDVSSLAATSAMHGIFFDKSGSTSGKVIAVGVDPGVEVIVQHTGSFSTPSQTDYAMRVVDPDGTPAPTDGIDGHTLFVSDNDEIYIGSTTTFTSLEVLFGTVSSKSIGQPPNTEGEYYFRNATVWAQFFPIDATEGWIEDGIINWEGVTLTGWKSDYTPTGGASGYWIKVKRTRGGSFATPAPTTVKILASETNFGWDENGNLTVNTIAAIGGGITVGSGNGITVNITANLNSLLYKVTTTYAAYTDTDTTKGIVIATLPAKMKIVGCYADTTTPYTGGAVSATTLRVGITAEDASEILDTHDVRTGAVTKGLTDADLGGSLDRAGAIQGGYLPNWSGTTAIYATINTTTANTDALTAGSTTFYIETVQY